MFLKKMYQKYNIRYVFNSLIHYYSDNIGEYVGVTDYKRSVPVIVTISASKENYEDLVVTLYSLLNQSFKPDKLILFLDKADEQNINSLPYEITKFLKNGLEIEFINNLNPYTHINLSIKKYKNSIIVGASNQVYYQKNWLKRLYYSYISYPTDLHVHLADKLIIDNKVRRICSYLKWEKNVFEECSSQFYVPVISSGMLIPPNFFTSEVEREDIYLKNTPNSPQLWYWLMTLLNNKRVRVVKKHYQTVCVTDFFKSLSKKEEDTSTIIDTELENLMNYYYQNIMNKLSEG